MTQAPEFEQRVSHVGSPLVLLASRTGLAGTAMALITCISAWLYLKDLLSLSLGLYPVVAAYGACDGIGPNRLRRGAARENRPDQEVI